MEHKISEPNARVDVADVLRGLAVMGIIILHSIEHFNFYSFPDTVPCEWMKFTDKAIWNGLFFVFSNKAYAIFALLFGFSFYIQDNNQQRRGKDFRLRFIWRMALLFIIGQFNAAFFTGEILCRMMMPITASPLNTSATSTRALGSLILCSIGYCYYDYFRILPVPAPETDCCLCLYSGRRKCIVLAACTWDRTNIAVRLYNWSVSY